MNRNFINLILSGWIILTTSLGVFAEAEDHEGFFDPPCDELGAGITMTIMFDGSSEKGIRVNPYGGTPPYTYQWNDPAGSTTNQIDGLEPGVYCVTITDAANCTLVKCGLVYEPCESNIEITAAITMESAPGAADGAIDITITSATGAQAFLWTNPGNAQSEDLTGLTGESNEYCVRILDESGCVKLFCFTLETDCNPPLTCFGASTPDNGSGSGAIDLTVTGGTGPYSYQWSNGAFTKDISNLQFGSYCVTITDANGCKKKCCFDVNFQGCSPDFELFPEQIENETAEDASNGFIKVRMLNGTGPYNFQWSNGVSGNTSNNILILQGLPTGSYTLTVTDSNGCTSEVTVPVGLGCPANLGVDFNTQPASDGLTPDGVITALPQSGVPPFSYQWSNGATTQSVTGLPSQLYCVTITDSRGCTGSGCQLLGVQCTTFTFQLNGNSAPESSPGAGDGMIEVFPQPGTGGYSYQWSDLAGSTNASVTGLSLGEYFLTVLDQNGCEQQGSFWVNPPACPQRLGLITVVQDESFEGAQNGEISVSPTTGEGPYQYEWSNGATTHTLTGLEKGEYYVTVTDNAGCKDSECYFVGRSGCSAPDLLYPISGAIDIPESVTFAFNPAEIGTEPYLFELAFDPSFNNVLFSQTTSQTEIPLSLSANTNYCWRVQAQGCWSPVASFRTTGENCTLFNVLLNCPVGAVDLFADPVSGLFMIPLNPFAGPSGTSINLLNAEGYGLGFDLSSFWGSPSGRLNIYDRAEVGFIDGVVREIESQLSLVLDNTGGNPAIEIETIPTGAADVEVKGLKIEFFNFDSIACQMEHLGTTTVNGNQATINYQEAPFSDNSPVVEARENLSHFVFLPTTTSFFVDGDSFESNGIIISPIFEKIINQTRISVNGKAAYSQGIVSTENAFDVLIKSEKLRMFDHEMIGENLVFAGEEQPELIVGDPEEAGMNVKKLIIDFEPSQKAEVCFNHNNNPQSLGDSIRVKVDGVFPVGTMDLIINQHPMGSKILKVDFSASGSTGMRVETFNGGVQSSEQTDQDPNLWLSLIEEAPIKIRAGIDENTSEFYFELEWDPPVSIEINEGPNLIIDKIRFVDTSGGLPDDITGFDLEIEGQGDTRLSGVASCTPLKFFGRGLFEGAYDPIGEIMHNDLATQGLIPVTDPFGTGVNMGAGIDPQNETGAEATINWVRVDLRNPIDPTQIIESRVGLIQGSGLIIDPLTGLPGISFAARPRQPYRVSITGKGHLPDLSDIIVPYSFGNSDCGEAYLFYDSPSKNGNPGGQQEIVGGKPGPVFNMAKTQIGDLWLITSGDTNGDDIIDAADRSAGWNFRNQSGYLDQDVNWDGVVDAADRSMIWNNRNQTFNLSQ